MARAKNWTNPKYKRDYQGEYSYVKLNSKKQKRIFLLVAKTGKEHILDYSSPAKAEKEGWKHD